MHDTHHKQQHWYESDFQVKNPVNYENQENLCSVSMGNESFSMTSNTFAIRFGYLLQNTFGKNFSVDWLYNPEKGDYPPEVYDDIWST